MDAALVGVGGGGLAFLACPLAGAGRARARALAAAAAARKGLAIAAGMDAAEMLVEVLQAGEALAGVAFAVDVGAVQGVSRSAVLAVDFSLVAKQASPVGKAREFLATLDGTSVRSIVLVHVLAVT